MDGCRDSGGKGREGSVKIGRSLASRMSQGSGSGESVVVCGEGLCAADLKER